MAKNGNGEEPALTFTGRPARDPNRENPFTPAVFEQQKSIVAITGFPGQGKTKTALRVGRGLVGPDGKIAMIHTEEKRDNPYIGEMIEGNPDLIVRYDRMELHPPFTPSRFMDAIEDAAHFGYDVAIIDSFSDSWEGWGGILSIAETRGAKGLGKWSHKTDSKQIMWQMRHCGIHVILTFRAKDKLVQKKGSDKYISEGIIPICDKAVPGWFTVHLLLQEDGSVIYRRGPEQCRAAFETGKRPTEAGGAAIADWCRSGAAIDPRLQRAVAEGQMAATQGVTFLLSWWQSLSPDYQRLLAAYKDRLKAAAANVDYHIGADERQGPPMPAAEFATRTDPHAPDQESL